MCEEESMPEECTHELKAKQNFFLNNLILLDCTIKISGMMDCTCFNSAGRLLRVTA